jgi:hypothetical protein
MKNISGKEKIGDWLKASQPEATKGTTMTVVKRQITDEERTLIAQHLLSNISNVLDTFEDAKNELADKNIGDALIGLDQAKRSIKKMIR